MRGGGKVIEGLEGMLYTTNGLVGEEFHDYYIAAMYEYPDKVVLSAIDLLSTWAMDANHPVSLAMEKCVAEFLEIRHRHYNSSIGPMAVFTEEQKLAVTAIYDVTQRLLNAKNVSGILVYRGFSWLERPDWADVGLNVGCRICQRRGGPA